MNSLPLLDTGELSELIHTTEATLRFWRHMGKGPKHFSMGGRRVFYRREDVDAWLEEQYAASNPQPTRNQKPQAKPSTSEHTTPG